MAAQKRKKCHTVPGDIRQPMLPGFDAGDYLTSDARPPLPKAQKILGETVMVMVVVRHTSSQ